MTAPAPPNRPRRGSGLRAWAGILALVLGVGGGLPPASSATFTNPIAVASGQSGASDPSIVFKDGFYYWARNVNGDTAIGIAKARRLQDLGTAPMVTIFAPPDGQPYSRDIWAPELAWIDGRWYVYFAADDGDWGRHRMFALQADSRNPQGSWTFRGKVAVPPPYPDTWAIDGTVLQKDDGSLFFVWSGWQGTNDGFPQRLYIAPMLNPTTISGNRVEISFPDQPWERQGERINEGPAVLKHNGRIHIVYSASASWLDDYKLGLVTNSDGNVLNSPSWVKHPVPVFERNDAGLAFGPGHNGFVKSPDGREDWIVYHATAHPHGGWGDRSVRAQRFGWDVDGTPDFGRPVAWGEPVEEPSGTPASGAFRFEAANVAGALIRHRDGRLRLDADVSPVADSQWQQVPGLADPEGVSFESVNFPGDYLRHRNGEVWKDRSDGSAGFKADATWRKRPGAADADGVSFEAWNAPGRFLRHRHGLFFSEPLASPLDRRDATFRER